MKNKVYTIIKDSQFVISLFKDHFEVRKNSNKLNNRSYSYKEVKSIELRKERSSFLFYVFHVFCMLIAYLAPKVKNSDFLVIETADNSDSFYLKDYDKNAVAEVINLVNTSKA